LKDFSLRFVDFNNLREQNYANIEKVALKLLQKYKDVKDDLDLINRINPYNEPNDNFYDDIEGIL